MATLRVQHGTHRETVEDTDNAGEPVYAREVYQAGDEFEVPDDDLDRYETLLGERLARVDGEDEEQADDEADESGDSSDSEADTSEDTADESDADNGDESGEEQAESEADETEDDSGLSAGWVEDAEYDDLRSAASDYDDVNGNWSEDRLRTELRAKAEG